MTDTSLNLLSLQCPLCSTTGALQTYHQDKKREYLHCQHCDLVHVDKSQQLTASEEKGVYDQHENNPADLGYRTFLSRAWLPLKEKLISTDNGQHSSSIKGLDFGSGPGPTLSLMIQEQGFACNIFDLYYANDPAVLSLGEYDFVISTEVIEHIGAPFSVLSQLTGLLKEDGFLCLMTKRHTTQEAFKRWHYILDPTHITFFSERTFLWAADHFKLSVEFPDKDVVLFQKMI